MRGALAAGGRRLGGDGGDGFAPQLARTQPVLLQDFARRVDAREGVKQVLHADIAGGVKRGRVIGGVAAGQHR